jgi:hypothetical protein
MFVFFVPICTLAAATSELTGKMYLYMFVPCTHMAMISNSQCLSSKVKLVKLNELLIGFEERYSRPTTP